MRTGEEYYCRIVAELEAHPDLTDARDATAAMGCFMLCAKSVKRLNDYKESTNRRMNEMARRLTGMQDAGADELIINLTRESTEQVIADAQAEQRAAAISMIVDCVTGKRPPCDPGTDVS